MPRAAAPSAKSFIAKHVPAAAPVQTVSVQRDTSLFGAVKEGFGWGVGMQAARSLFGGGSTQPQTHIVQRSEPTEFERCIAEHKDDVALCAHLAQKK